MVHTNTLQTIPMMLVVPYLFLDHNRIDLHAQPNGFNGIAFGGDFCGLSTPLILISPLVSCGTPQHPHANVMVAHVSQKHVVLHTVNTPRKHFAELPTQDSVGTIHYRPLFCGVRTQGIRWECGSVCVCAPAKPNMRNYIFPLYCRLLVLVLTRHHIKKAFLRCPWHQQKHFGNPWDAL